MSTVVLHSGDWICKFGVNSPGNIYLAPDFYWLAAKGARKTYVEDLLPLEWKLVQFRFVNFRTELLGRKAQIREPGNKKPASLLQFFIDNTIYRISARTNSEQ